MTRFALLRWLPAALLALATGAGAQPAAWPEKPIVIVVPFPAGGPTDASARLFGRLIGAELKQPVLIDNRAGAGGTVGTTSVTMAAPDGYTLLWGGTSSLAVAPALYRNLRYDPLKSFVPVGMAVRGPLLIAGNGALAPKTLKELVARAKGSRLTIATAGNGSVGHLGAEAFQEAAKIELVHVPYRGGAPAVTDLLAGQVDLIFELASFMRPHIQAGKAQPYATTGAQRYAQLPDVPTVSEVLGVPFEAYSWFGLVAPAGTPAAVVQALSGAMQKAAADPELRRELQAGGQEVVTGTPEQFGRAIQADLAKWSGIVQRAGVKPD